VIAEEVPAELLKAVKDELKKQIQGFTTKFYTDHLEYARAKGVLEGIEKSLAAMDAVVVRYRKSMGD
jgi:hypothetical protein